MRPSFRTTCCGDEIAMLPPFPAPFLYYPNRDVPRALRAFIDFVKRRAV